ncbi:putative tex-like protein, HTH domain superfamily [Helianthus annuus]|nr:putative tex-like protein, HTH domain superfamily [Helianthus annuus]
MILMKMGRKKIGQIVTRRDKRRKNERNESERNFVLDEDDYELLQDNNVGYRRPKESQKFKRLKKARADADEGQSGFSDEEEYDVTGKGGRSAEDKIKRSLFDDDEGPPLEDIAEEDPQLEEEDVDIGEEEEDEMADFIVDEDEVDEHGEPTRRRKVHKKKLRQAPGVSSTAIQEAHEIFGDVDVLLMQRKLELGGIGRYEEAGEKRLEDEFDPIILSEKYMTEYDKRIRDIDIPERMQISEESTGPPPTDEVSIEDESNWILNQLRTGTVPLFTKGHELAVRMIGI